MEEPALQQEQPEGLYNGFAFEHNAANHSYFESQENLGGSLKYRVIVVQTSALDRQLYEKLYQTRKTFSLTWPGPESRLTTLVLLRRSKSKILPP